MRTKSLVEPTGVSEGHEWLSPDGHSPSWHKVWTDGKWELASVLNPDSLEEVEIDLGNKGSSLLETTDTDETEDTEEEEESTEDQSDEQSMQTEVSDSDRGEQGTGGKPEPKPEQRGERGKVRQRRKGKQADKLP